MADRTDPTHIPWTVSVAVYPGEEPCPELESLDRKLSKTRWFDPFWDALLFNWIDQIEWPKPKEPEPLEWLQLASWMIREQSDREIEFDTYLDWLGSTIAACF